MKRLRPLFVFLVMLPALSLWGQADHIEGYPTGEEVRPLKVLSLETLAAVFADPERDESDRLSAVFVLSRSEDPNAVPLLIDMMREDPFASVRREAAKSLGSFHAAEAAAALRESAANEFLASSRWAAGVSLLRIQPNDVGFLQQILGDVDVLAEAGLTMQDPSVSDVFPRALIPYVEDALIGALQDRLNFNSVERSATLKSLAQLRTARAIPVMLNILNDESDDAFVRGTAAFALGQLGVRDAVSDLIAFLKAGQTAISIGALDALGNLVDEQALQPITEILETSESIELRLNAARVLSSYGPAAIPPLTAALNSDESISVREEALTSLAQIGGDAATQVVLDFVEGDFFSQCNPVTCSGIALETLSALATLGQGEKAVSLLESSLDQLRDSIPLLFAFVEPDLVRVATQIGAVAPQVFELLLADPSPYVQNLGIIALVNVRGRSVRETILPYINPDAHVIVRRAALEGLAQMAIPDDVDLFAEWLLDRDRRSRLASFTALAGFGDERALPPLFGALSDSRFSVRIQAAEAGFVYSNRIERAQEALEIIDPDAMQRGL